MAEKKSIQILNVHILDICENELLEQFNEGVLYTPNIDHLISLQKDKEFWRIKDEREKE